MKTEIINKKLGNILNDKTSGSLDLLLKVNNIIKNNLGDGICIIGICL